MKVVILTSKLHPAAEFAINKMLKSKDDLEIVGLIVSDISPFTKSYWKYLSYGVKRSGLFYGLLTAIVCYFHLIGFLVSGLLYWWRKRQWLSLPALAATYKIPMHYTQDINSAETIAIIKDLEPDLIVSVYFNQILKTEAIELAKIGTLNLHPGLLPGYRGVWPDFWKLYKGEKQAGITIHYINEKIDEGEILAQHLYPIEENDTKLSLSLKAAHHGSKKLIEVIRQFKLGLKPHPIAGQGKPRYRSFPKRNHFKRFHQKGKRLFCFFRDLPNIIKIMINLDHYDQSSSSKSSASESSASDSEPKAK